MIKEWLGSQAQATTSEESFATKHDLALNIAICCSTVEAFNNRERKVSLTPKSAQEKYPVARGELQGFPVCNLYLANVHTHFPGRWFLT